MCRATAAKTAAARRRQRATSDLRGLQPPAQLAAAILCTVPCFRFGRPTRRRWLLLFARASLPPSLAPAPSFCKSATPAPLAVTWQHQTLSFGGGGQAQGGSACWCGARNPDWQGLSNRAAAVAGALSARRAAACLPQGWVLQCDWPMGAPGRCLIAALGPEDAPSTRPSGLRQVPARPGLGSWQRRRAGPGSECAAGSPFNTTCPQTCRGGPGAVHKSSAWPA